MNDDALFSQADFETRSIHLGSKYREETGAVIPPIFLTSTFESGNPGGFDYTRSGNPNFRNLETTLASLEGGKFATVFASGVSAITAVVSSLQSGDVIVAEENVYGCTYRLFEQVFRKFGLTVVYLDLTAEEEIASIPSYHPRLVWLESPTNPLLKILDIAKISACAKAAGASVLVDNTFASSFCQQPLLLGADLSLLSTTKYTNGHSDALGGAVCTNSPEWADRMVFAQKALGLQPSPMDAWLTLRGLKTQALRMERHSANALTLAHHLRSILGSKGWVRYPHLDGSPGYEIACRQMKLGSGLITADLALSLDQTRQFLQNLRFFTLAESLGGIESLICHPASMTHASVPKEVRDAVGITDGLVRFSIGIESADDLRSDIDRAFASLASHE